LGGHINAYDQKFDTLGDFNIEPEENLLDKTFFVRKDFIVPPQNQNESGTNLIFDETKYYDQIAWFNSMEKSPDLKEIF